MLSTDYSSQSFPSQFKGGKFHGQGVYEWSNGAKYVGEHDLDQRTGFGTMIYPDGAEFSGIWENGVHVKFQDSPDEEVTTTTTTRRSVVRSTTPVTTTSSPEVTTRRRKKVIRRKKGRKRRPVGDGGGQRKRTKKKRVKKERRRRPDV